HQIQLPLIAGKHVGGVSGFGGGGVVVLTDLPDAVDGDGGAVRLATHLRPGQRIGPTQAADHRLDPLVGQIAVLDAGFGPGDLRLHSIFFHHRLDRDVRVSLRGVDDVQPASVGTTHNLIIVGLIDRLSYADAAPTGFLVGPMVNGIPANQFA